MTAAEALELYKSRDASEKLFRGDKSYLGNKSYRVYTDESVSAKIENDTWSVWDRCKVHQVLDGQDQRKVEFLKAGTETRQVTKTTRKKPGRKPRSGD